MIERFASRAVARSLGNGSAETRVASYVTQSPLQWLGRDMPLFPEWDGEKAVNSAYLSNMYVYRCVEATANALAKLPFRAGMDPSAPQTYSTPQYSKLAYLLSPPPGSPNPQWTPKMLWRYSIIQYILTGKWVWHKEYSPSGQLLGLWPLPAQYVFPVPRPRGSQGTDYFSDYVYRIQGQEIKLGRDKVFYAWNPSQKDPLQPESILQAASLRIAVGQMLDRYDYALLKNNGVPSTVVTTEPFATSDDRRAFRQQFVDTFGGYDNAGKTMFLEAEPDISADGSESNNVAGKISVARLGMTAKEMQQNEKAKQVIDDITIALGVPLSVLGKASEQSFNNSDTEIKNWWNEKLLPLKGEIEDQVNLRLAPECGRQLGWFDTSQVRALKDSPELDAGQIHDLVSGPVPVLTVDEAREYLGKKPWAEVAPAPAPTPVQLPAPAPVPALPAALPDPAPRIKLVARSIATLLNEQRTALLVRADSRRGRKIDDARELFDMSYWDIRGAQILGPALEYLGMSVEDMVSACRELNAESRRLLGARVTVADAFGDLEARATSYARKLVRGTEPVRADHVLLVLEAVQRGRLEAAKAAELWKGQN
jgi:HK97 family phage portal protein